MFLIKLQSIANIGLNGKIIDVEVDILNAMPNIVVVGLGDTAVQESKERVRSAIKNSHYPFPRGRVVVNLAPADIRKMGPNYDLPIALGVLLASGAVDLMVCKEKMKDSIFLGELSLDGKLRQINGALLLATEARKHGYKKIFLPKENAQEASLEKNIKVFPIENLKQLGDYLNGKKNIEEQKFQNLDFEIKDDENNLDMKYVKGQEFAKRALEIAASGGHNIIFTGPPGSGKTLLARTFATILPKLTFEESLEITKIYSLSGLISEKNPLVRKRPFRAVHHTASGVSLIGGGTHPSPGEITLANKGVLFLDEIAEFPVQVLEVLRQPLEDGFITISRASMKLDFPANFILIAAMNPCPCGFANDPHKSCKCDSRQIDRYRKKISGPFLDRIDLHIDVPRIDFKKISADEDAESSKSIREKVETARQIQRDRFKNKSIEINSDMTAKQIKKYCKTDDEGKKILEKIVDNFHISGRGFHRILKVSRSIADLENSENIKASHIGEALQYRQKEE